MSGSIFPIFENRDVLSMLPRATIIPFEARSAKLEVRVMKMPKGPRVFAHMRSESYLTTSEVIQLQNAMMLAHSFIIDVTEQNKPATRFRMTDFVISSEDVRPYKVFGIPGSRLRVEVFMTLNVPVGEYQSAAINVSGLMLKTQGEVLQAAIMFAHIWSQCKVMEAQFGGKRVV